MCREHWYQVPYMLRNRIWATWNNGHGAGSEAHLQAIAAAIEALNGGR